MRRGWRPAEGSQVAFIQGDPTLAAEESPNVPQAIFGTDITGLEPGMEYELQWAQASRASDGGHGALSVVLSDPANPAGNYLLVDWEPVQNKGEWEIQKHIFLASAPIMRLNFLHAAADPAVRGSGTETTLIDDFRLRKTK